MNSYLKPAGIISKNVKEVTSMKKFKKGIYLLLVISIFCIGVTSALALSGTVVGGRLNLRKTASTSATIIGYIPNGSTVTILDQGSITNGFYHITAPSYLSGQTPDDCVNRTGYGMAQYIQ